MPKKFSKIYFPATMEILTPGHLMCIRYLEKKSKQLIIGLLSEKALRGYKKCAVPFKQRKKLLELIGVKVVQQDSLNPYANCKRYKVDAIASGDGWEKEELEAINRLGIEKIDIPFKKIYASSLIKKNILTSHKSKNI